MICDTDMVDCDNSQWPEPAVRRNVAVGAGIDVAASDVDDAAVLDVASCVWFENCSQL